MKIAIIGYSGCGKSTLAKNIAQTFDLPLLYLDQVNFLSDWRERDSDESIEIVRSFIEKESWVVDGNYRKLLQERRVEEADLIICMRFNRFVCLWRALKRYVSNYNKTRESAANGCIEKMDFAFVKWILKDGRTKDYEAHYKGVMHDYRQKLMVVPNQKKLDQLYKIINTASDVDHFISKVRP